MHSHLSGTPRCDRSVTVHRSPPNDHHRPVRDAVERRDLLGHHDRVVLWHLMFGIGAGRVPAETTHHGVPFERRFDVMRVHVLAMRALWIGREVSLFDMEVLAARAEWAFEDDGAFRIRRVDADDQLD